MLDRLDLTGKRALITGAGGGIGRAIALRLSESGMKLALVGRDPQKLVRTAALTGRPLVDLDAEIAEAENCCVPDIINTYGEAHFRDLETRQVRRFAKESGLVIACGGGTPLREINRRLLRQNGKVFFLHRDLALLPTDGRPLSVNLEELTRVRGPIYDAAADVHIENNSRKVIAAQQILEAF